MHPISVKQLSVYEFPAVAFGFGPLFPSSCIFLFFWFPLLFCWSASVSSFLRNDSEVWVSLNPHILKKDFLISLNNVIVIAMRIDNMMRRNAEGNLKEVTKVSFA